jgi:CheY-like chemotaxis protein
MTKIMLVEDDNNLREIYEARLSAEGYEIVSAENGEAALAMAAKERPDMIISDVMMPKISGFEMLDILRNTNSLKDVKIIMLTALGQAEDSQRANSLGADRYLVKSQVTLEDIVKATHDLLDDPNTVTNVPAVEDAADTAAPDEPDAPTTPAAEAETPAAESAAPEASTPVTAPEPAAAEPVSQPAALVTEDVSAPATDAAVDVTAPATDTPAVNDTPAQDASDTPAPALNVVEPPTPTDQPSTLSPVISIPISDGGGGDDTQASSDNAPDSATVAPISVVEPPAEPAPDVTAPELTVVEPPVESSTDPSTESNAETAPAADSADYTSPASFNNFQETVAPAESAETTPEPAAAEPETTLAPVSPEVATDEPEAPAVEIPSLMPASDMPPASDLDIEPSSLGGPADPIPQPEELDNFSAPVIEAPENATVNPATPVPTPTVQSIPITDGNAGAESEPEVASSDDVKEDQLREAADDLAEGASEAVAESSQEGANGLKIISPLPADDSKPTIHQLLAVEEAKNSAQQAVQATQQPKPNVDAYNSPAARQAPPTQPDEASDPNSISL